MRILYSIQGTGNGHISRAESLYPYLKTIGEVDFFLSGSNTTYPTSIPIKYKSKGWSFMYSNCGGLHIGKSVLAIRPYGCYQEAKDLPLENYDVIISDFEFITSLSAQLKNRKIIHLSHQASFLSTHTPRPSKKDWVGELVLKNWVKSDIKFGLHFHRYDDFIYPAIIKDEIRHAHPVDHGHITVYLPAYNDKCLFSYFQQLKEYTFHLFSKEAKRYAHIENVHIRPIDREVFTDSMVHASGIICGAGFETPAEALYLKKKMVCIPIRGQYEQKCNGAALEALGIQVLDTIDERFPEIVENSMCKPFPMSAAIPVSNPIELLEDVFDAYYSNQVVPQLQLNRRLLVS